MNQLEHFERTKDWAAFRPSGEVTLEEAVRLVASGIAFAREQGIRNLMVNTSELIGFPPPSITERYYFVQQWARVARGGVRVAMVARPEMIDREKFGITVAANNGLIAEVFTSEEKALAWLQTRPEHLPASSLSSVSTRTPK